MNEERTVDERIPDIKGMREASYINYRAEKESAEAMGMSVDAFRKWQRKELQFDETEYPAELREAGIF